MRNFKGFDDWIEIFRGGPQIDSLGKKHDGDEVIEKAIATFNVAGHKAPLVVGHPEDNGPAFGWVEGLKETINDGIKVLLAKFKQVMPEFEEAVKKGLYKHRSASFYPDGRLKHVGFLGAIPPAVKGLADIKFMKGGDVMSFEFSEVKDPGEELSLKVDELLKQSREFTEDDREIESSLTYREAFETVMRKNPELTEKYTKNLGLTV